MFAKLLKFLGLFFLLTTLTGCPGGDEDDCFDYGSTTRVDDLVFITPFQSTYNVGDIITYKLEIPATNSFFGEELNLFEKTNDYNARLVTNPILFNNNEVTYVKGAIEAHNGGWSSVTYNPTNQMYEIEIRVKLLRLGFYSLNTTEIIEFQGSTKCNRYRLDTNIIHNEPGPGVIEFTVQ